MRQTESQALKSAAIAALALVDVAGFAAATCPGYIMGQWHRVLGQILDDVLADVMAGKEPRVIIDAPPRHGKTELVGRSLGPCLMARMPGARIIYATHTQQPNADMVSLDARRKVADYLAPYLPHLQRADGSKWTAPFWEPAEGGFLAVGAGVGTSGQGAHLAVVDDPFGSAEDVMSKATRERVKRWYRYDIESRIMGGGGVVVMHTRWHEDDLVGWLLKEQPGQWRVYSWPAIAREDEPGLRAAGDALVPHLYSIDRLSGIRSRVGMRAWASLYQQRPVPDGGNRIKREWFSERYTVPPMSIAAQADEVWLSVDTGKKKAVDSDYTVIQAWCRTLHPRPKRHLLDRRAERVGYPEFESMMDGMVSKWAPMIKARGGGVLIEDTANGTTYLQVRGSSYLGIPLIAFHPSKHTPGKDKSKSARAAYLERAAESGEIILPDPGIAPWIEDVIAWWVAFPLGAHDDDVDTASQLMMRWTTSVVDIAEWEEFSGVA